MESNRRVSILPAIQIKSIFPSEKKSVSESKLNISDDQKMDILKSSSIENRKLIIKLNSIQFINGVIIRENFLESPLGRIYPSFYSSTFNLPQIKKPETPSLIGKFQDLKLDKYKHVRVLGKNSLLIESIDSGVTYVFKHLEFISDDNQKNIDCIQKIKHVSLTSINECLFSKKISYIISEYSNLSFENFKLFEHNNKIKFIDMFRQSLKACYFLHEAHILHSNLKPSNFLIDSNGCVKLADFGFINLVSNRITYLLKLVNDPVNRLYIPIETYRDFKYTIKSDLYALGAVFYQLITDKIHSFSESNSFEDLFEIVKSESFYNTLVSLLNNSDIRRMSTKDVFKYLHFEENHQVLGSFSTGYLNSSLVSCDDKKLVLKKFHTQSLELRENLQKLVNISHINLISISYYIPINNNFMVFRDYVDDFVNLEVKLRIFNLSEDVLLNKWLTQILNGLSHLQKQGLRHGNLKMTNILINLKSDLIKLADFGYLNYLTESLEQCDIFDLGRVMYKCIACEDYFEYEPYISDNFKRANFCDNLKNYVLNMLSPNRDLRPDLITLSDNLVNKTLLKFQLNISKTINLPAMCHNLVSTESGFYALTRFKKSQKAIYECFKIRSDKFTIEKLFLNLSQIKRVKCKCESFRGSIQSPKLFCSIDSEFILGCNSDYFFLLNSKLMCIKLMCLIEILEMSPGQEQKHTSLVNKSNLGLNTECLAYDHKNSRLYLLVTVHMKFYFLNIFDCELVKHRQGVRFNLKVVKMLHMNILDTSKSSDKKMALNQSFIFVSDDIVIRVFNKENLKHLFTINHDVKIGNSRFTNQSIYFGALGSEVLNEQDDEIVIQNFNVDSKGYLYVVFNNLVKCYDQNAQFLWKFKFPKNSLNGRIVDIGFNKNESLILIVQDDRNEQLNRVLIFN